MLREVGYCSGIENYSRHLDQRVPGSPPWTLMDYLPSDYLLFIDESHMTVPQIRGCITATARARPPLTEYGFRLPSALDNRPLTFDEFEAHKGYTVYTSATPALRNAARRPGGRADHPPTGLLDPEVEVRPTKGRWMTC
jgi:excinuclease ABC subunit B